MTKYKVIGYIESKMAHVVERIDHKRIPFDTIDLLVSGEIEKKPEDLIGETVEIKGWEPYIVLGKGIKLIDNNKGEAKMTKPQQVGKYKGQSVFLTDDGLGLERDNLYLSDVRNPYETASIVHEILGEKELQEVEI